MNPGITSTTDSATSGQFAAPTLVDGFKELRTGWDMIRLAARTPELLGAPRGDGRAVVVVPGFRATDASLFPLRSFLAQRGHDAHRIATLGTPLLGPRYTLGRRAYPEAELQRIEALIDERSERPIDVPTMAIYSRNDGVVDWRTCPDLTTSEAVNVEVSSSHIGMGLDPTVWMHLARWLAT